MWVYHLFRRRSWRSVSRAFFLRYLYGKRGRRLVHGLRLYYRLQIESIISFHGRFARYTRFPRRTKALLWVDGDEVFPRIEKRIRRAKHTIVIQMFIWKDDNIGRRIAGSLVEAADRGVKVDITKDSTGDVFELNLDFISTKKSKEPVWRLFWSHPNINVNYLDENNHSKVYIFDDRILILGGMNIADEYEGSWHDFMVELHGPRFVQEYLSGGDLDQGASDSVSTYFNSQDRKEIRPALETLIREAQNSIVIEMSYISDRRVVDLLVEKSHQDVRITLILPEKPDLHHHANMVAVERLMEKGNLKNIQVLLYPDFLHSKAILIDRKKLFTGSANLMKSSLDAMGEVNVLISGRRRAIWKMRSVMSNDILKSKPLLSPPHLRWLGRWLAWLGL